MHHLIVAAGSKNLRFTLIRLLLHSETTEQREQKPCLHGLCRVATELREPKECPNMMLGDAFYRKSLTLGIVQASLTLHSLTRDFQSRIILLFELSVGSRHARTHGYYMGDAFGVIN